MSKGKTKINRPNLFILIVFVAHCDVVAFHVVRFREPHWLYVSLVIVARIIALPCLRGQSGSSNLGQAKPLDGAGGVKPDASFAYREDERAIIVHRANAGLIHLLSTLLPLEKVAI